MTVMPVPPSSRTSAQQRSHPHPHQLPAIPSYDTLVKQQIARRLVFGRMLLNWRRRNGWTQYCLEVASCAAPTMALPHVHTARRLHFTASSDGLLLFLSEECWGRGPDPPGWAPR